MTADHWRPARRLLCVRLDSLGDVLMSTPAIRALKCAQPDRHITLLTSPAGAELAGLLPDVDDVMVYESPWMKATPARPDATIDWQFIRHLQAGRFDAAVIFTVFTQNPLPAAMLCYLAEIPLRLAHCRENPYQLLTDWVIDDEPHRRVRHEVRRQLDLVASVECRTEDERLTMRVPDEVRRRVQAMLRARGLSGQRRWLVIHPGASAPSRRYPPEFFAQMAAELTRRHGFQVVLTGTAAERPLVEAIGAGLGRCAISLADQLSLAELAGLLSMAPLLVANNTGPVHLAAAVGTPVVDLYALTNPQHTPWMVPHRLLYCDVECKYCFKSVCPMGHHRCLQGVPPQLAVAAVLDLCQQEGSPRGPASEVPSLPAMPAVRSAPLAGAPISV
ncbi:MAG: lipopolysaccharide heptosyltransferase II [Pirellulaceae bacterium]